MELIDRNVLQQLADDIGSEMMPTAITLFIEEVQALWQQLHCCHRQRQWVKVADLAHNLKSMCASYGAMLSYQQLIALESACKSTHVTEIVHHIELLEHSLYQALSFLTDDKHSFHVD